MARAPAPGTRDRILDVASRLFYLYGVRAVGMNLVISEAGTGKNLLYRHFATKADLVAAYLERAREARAASARRARDAAGDDPREQIVAVVAEVGAKVRRPGFRGCAFRNYLSEFPEDDGLGSQDAEPTPGAVARRHLVETHGTLVELVEHMAIDDADDRVRLVEQIWLLIDGLYLQAAYRDRLDGRLGVDSAVDLARRLVRT